MFVQEQEKQFYHSSPRLSGVSWYKKADVEQKEQINYYYYFRGLDYSWLKKLSGSSLWIFTPKISKLGTTWTCIIVNTIITNRVSCWKFYKYTSLEYNNLT